MQKIEDLLLLPSSTVKEALKIIDFGAKKIALIVDSDKNLIGTITDGDIRRGLLSGLRLEDSIENIIFKNPTTCKIDDSKDKILEIALEKKIVSNSDS